MTELFTSAVGVVGAAVGDRVIVPGCRRGGRCDIGVVAVAAPVWDPFFRFYTAAIQLLPLLDQ